MHNSRMGAFQFFLLLVCALLVCSGLRTHGMENDMNAFWLWGDRLFSRGISNFYAPDYFSDYPPGYLYVLWMIGAIGSLTGINYSSTASYVLLKVPSILTFLALVAIVMRSIDRFSFSDSLPKGSEPQRMSDSKYRTATFLVFCFFVSPAIWHNVGWFGQVDVIAVLIGVMAIWTLRDRKFVVSGVLWALLISTKPQGVFLGPGALALLWTQRSSLTPKILSRSLVAFTITLLVLFAPFWVFNTWSFTEHFVKMFSTYSYASVNAPNLFFVMGANWRPMAETVWGIRPWTWFFLIVSLLSTLTFYSYRYSRNQLAGKILEFKAIDAMYLGFLAASSFFLFAPNMHERYFIIALSFAPFLLLRTKMMFFSLIVFSFAGFLAQQLVLDNFGDRKLPIEGPMVFASFYGFLASFAMAWWSWLFIEPREETIERSKKWYCRDENVIDRVCDFIKNPRPLRLNERDWTLSGKDIVALVAVLIFSVVVMFYQLGNTQRPFTSGKIDGGKVFSVELEGEVSTVKVYALSGSGSMRISCSVAPENVSTENVEKSTTQPTMAIDHVSVLGWKDFTISAPCRKVYLKMENPTEQVDIAALVFKGADHQRVQAIQICNELEKTCEKNATHPWTDENYEYLDLPDRMTGTIFDEIYYARSAMELLDGKSPYENTHPALSKVMMASVANRFGLAPFQWRAPAAFCGALLPFLLFFFCYLLGLSRSVAYVTLSLSLFDLSRISIGRLATIDMLAAFCLIPVYMAVVLVIRRRVGRVYKHGGWIDLDFKDWVLYGTVGLLLGINVGLKWVAILTVGAVGMILICLVIYEWFTTRKDQRGTFVLQSYGAAVFVILVGCGVYYLSFYPQYVFVGDTGSFHKMFLDAQKNMFSYHYNLVASHPFSSKVYSWPFLQKPLWLHVQNLKDAYVSVVVIGAPVFWYAATASILGIWWVGRLSQSWSLLLVYFIFIMQWLPWLGVNRIMYLYHYFPSACFLWVVLACLLVYLAKEGGWKRRATVLLFFAGIINFLMYLPVSLGLLTSRDYVASYLQWFDGWFF